MKKECFFCNFFKTEKDFLKTKYFYIRFDNVPVSPGHIEIVPERHVQSIIELTNDEWKDLKFSINKSLNLIKQTNLRKFYTERYNKSSNIAYKFFAEAMLKTQFCNKKFQDYNIGINNGKYAGQTIDHLHIHIIPRYKGDVRNPVGGIRNVIPDLADYKKYLK